MVQVNHALTVITKEDASHHQEEQQGDHSRYGELQPSLFDI